MQAVRRRLPARGVAAIETIRTLRMTAQQVDNTVSAWFADTAGSPARFQVMLLLWASEARGVPYKDIAANLGVTRATVSGLMAGLDRDGFIRAESAPGDRRVQLARLTEAGEAAIARALDLNGQRLEKALVDLSAEELGMLADLLRRLGTGFTAGG